MRVLVIGSGGREHALVWKIAQSPLVKKIYCAPGNAGIAGSAECVPLKVTDLEGLLAFAKKEKIELTVVGPELPLVGGIADVFQREGLAVFGPAAGAARLEGSKVFSKKCMQKYGIPTAMHEVFTSANEAQRHIKELKPPFVIKADGLAAGKGVVIALTHEEANQTLTAMISNKIFGEAGHQVVIEDFLSGEELSILAFTDGKKVIPLASSQDHKRAYDNDHGPNTGGMGAYSPCPLVSDAELNTLAEKTITPLVRGLGKDGIEYRGLIYAGLMLTEKGPYVLEYNVRFGDPEAQVVLARLDEDLVPILQEVAAGRLTRDNLRWKKQAAITVVMASKGYPGDYSTGLPLAGLDRAAQLKDVVVFHAGTKLDAAARVVTAGGRVLNVTALGASLQEARDRAYEAVKQIQFEGAFYRKDIGWRALKTVHTEK